MTYPSSLCYFPASTKTTAPNYRPWEQLPLTVTCYIQQEQHCLLPCLSPGLGGAVHTPWQPALLPENPCCDAQGHENSHAMAVPTSLFLIWRDTAHFCVFLPAHSHLLSSILEALWKSTPFFLNTYSELTTGQAQSPWLWLGKSTAIQNCTGMKNTQ